MFTRLRVALGPREAFPLTWDDGDAGSRYWTASFKTAKGTPFMVTFNGDSAGAYQIDFMNGGVDEFDAQTITGTGEAPAVFATVGAAVLQFMRKMSAKSVYFTAKEPSRAKLYAVLAAKLAAAVGGQFKRGVETEDSWGHDLDEPLTRFDITLP